MATVVREDGSVTSEKIKCTSSCVACEDGCASLSSGEIDPLFGLQQILSDKHNNISPSLAYSWMPVQFSQTTWLDSHHRSGDRSRDREVPRVENLNGASSTWGLDDRDISGVTNIGAADVGTKVANWVLHSFFRRLASSNIGVWTRHSVEGGLVHAWKGQ